MAAELSSNIASYRTILSRCLSMEDKPYSAIIGQGNTGEKFTLKEWWGNIWQILIKI